MDLRSNGKRTLQRQTYQPTANVPAQRQTHPSTANVSSVIYFSQKMFCIRVSCDMCWGSWDEDLFQGFALLDAFGLYGSIPAHLKPGLRWASGSWHWC